MGGDVRSLFWKDVATVLDREIRFAIKGLMNFLQFFILKKVLHFFYKPY